MDRVVIDSDEVLNYIKIMSKHLDNFMRTIETMRNNKATVNWTSDNKDRYFALYDNAIKDYLSFAEKMIQYVDYLTGYVEKYDGCLTEIKNNFQNINIEYDEEDIQ